MWLALKVWVMFVIQCANVAEFHVCAGVAAVYLANNPDASPQEVSSIITSTATPNKIIAERFKAGTPNKLVYSKLDREEGVVLAANGP